MPITDRRQAILDAIDELRVAVERLDDPIMTPPGERLPMQPIVVVDRIYRFRANAIVARLSMGRMNEIAAWDVPVEDVAQFYQLIGYSVSGYGDLDGAIGLDIADAIVAEMLAAAEREP